MQLELYALNLLGENRPIFKLIDKMQECKELVSISFHDSTQINKFTVTAAPKNEISIISIRKDTAKCTALTLRRRCCYTAVSSRRSGPGKR